MKIAAETGDTSEQGFAARKDSGLLPDSTRPSTSCAPTARWPRSRRSTSRPTSPVRPRTDRRLRRGPQWQLILDNLWPLAKAAITMTIPLTIISFVVGLVIALAVALARLSSNVVLANRPVLHLDHPRHAAAGAVVHRLLRAAPVRGEHRPFPAAIIAFSLNVGGYAAEVIRSAILSIPKGQWEAAQTIGMGYATTLRRIILPQAARVAVPPLSNTLISLVKDTSLASMILVTELLRVAQIAAAPTFEFFALYGTGRPVLLGDLPGPVVRPEPPRNPTGKVRGPMTEPCQTYSRPRSRGVHKPFDDHRCSRAIVNVAAGTVTVIIGPSGSGKTTVLRSLNALDIPDAGTIRIGDVSVDFGAVSEGPVAASARRAAWCSRPTTCSRT